MTVYFNQTLTIPYAGMILRRNPVNISILAGNDDIVLVLYDPSGSQYDFSIAAGQKILQRNFDLFRFEITGTGQAAVAISYPEVIEPSIEITLNPNLPQSVSSKQLPASLDSDGFFQIRYLGASDSPFRSWTLGSSDTPDRSWTLGASDVPNRGWTLGSGDVPNRGWNLGSSDVPGRGWTLGSGDTPDRSWTLGSSDNPYVLINSGEVTLDAFDYESNTTVATVPSSEIWTLLGVTILGNVYESGYSTLAALGVLRSNETSIPGIVGSNYVQHALLVMSYASDTPGGGTVIVGSASVAESSTNIYQYSVQEQWAKNPILYPGDEIYFVASNFVTNGTDNSIYISYSKQTIP